MFELRDYQQDAVDKALALIESNTAAGNRHLFSSPTGTGKSVIELELMRRIPRALLITPRIEIIRGMVEKYAPGSTSGMNEIALARFAWNEMRIATPIRLRNYLAEGSVPFSPEAIVIDESHHDSADTYKDIEMYLGGIPALGFTATPYRGTPKGTKALLDRWGNTVHTVLSLQDAVARGYYAIPATEIWPLIDDDMIDVTNGEFSVKRVESRLENNYAFIAEHCRAFWNGVEFDKATIITVPGQDSARAMSAALQIRGIPSDIVIDSTTPAQRLIAFSNVSARKSILVQVNVVSEGVDLPIQRIIDCAPTMSPVRWFQQVGRIRVVNGSTPEYICTCRNLERHCYLWEGLLQNTEISAAQQAFTNDKGEVKRFARAGARALGLEGFGQFAVTPVQLLNGTYVYMYLLSASKPPARTTYIAIVHPGYKEPICGVKTDITGNSVVYGRWSLIESIPDTTGFGTLKAHPVLTPKQQARWIASAQHFGLNPHVLPNSREFGVLPFLIDTKLRFH